MEKNSPSRTLQEACACCPVVVLGGGKFLMSETPLHTAGVIPNRALQSLAESYRSTSPIRKRTPLEPLP